jgi:hypothetical protein
MVEFPTGTMSESATKWMLEAEWQIVASSVRQTNH